MSMHCDNCNGEIAVPAIGTIKGVAFSFCSPDCRKGFADFSKTIGHPMVIPAAACDERGNGCTDQPVLLVTRHARETSLAETACVPRPVHPIVVSHYSTCKGDKA